ncbi:protein phosphatase 1H-like [Mizuhopecten yessoensis]|uniref:Protein phosphatase 1H n=1 Tax=Mizuhopecten yessoensis TaxID=6573 RepID=A0A210PYH7_MIZYE|nr:protein phosphatase 1H-like [Mizuhopecten yessoensis]XP_021371772.1 protein phosphatase 1H-like [Mizuhopecten yessoensis]XP_021371773.1 protein phosphatase 1H-like [Mizuhopecten yessoensis]XP_021371775.1 protein phosphatase 1H-like [Mizuhopecten yessoensis]XP_021371776.1 protein phosphatase 1H-like [Mizuhopecten yessoensis]OWF41534.1 Protein phosphatase 1H [Mizuhopecten yessoensis]
MWGKVQVFVGGVVSRIVPKSNNTAEQKKPQKYLYERPHFLCLGQKQQQEAKSTSSRTILTVGENLPRRAGYAEVINGGKSAVNEDQGAAEEFYLGYKPAKTAKALIQTATASAQKQPLMAMTEVVGDGSDVVPVTYFGIFDGHAGADAAIFASKILHKHIEDKLNCAWEVINQKLAPSKQDAERLSLGNISNISVDDLITGILEEAFVDLDDQIMRERLTYTIRGGCAAIIAMFMFGKVYVANAGDCRAVLCNGEKTIPLSRDHTPYAERERLTHLGDAKPELLHGEFTCTEYTRRIFREDVGRRVLYRSPHMSGWGYKVADYDALKFPLVTRNGKKSRLMETIGVARGFGDHDLRVFDSEIYVKPFLSSIPEVEIYDTKAGELGENCVLIMASDGLWDVISNSEAAAIVRQTLATYNTNDYKRYTAAARELVTQARGFHVGQGWRKKNTDDHASFDDITVFVIPLHD